MQLYVLSDSEGMRLLTLTAQDDDQLETDLIMFANAIAGAGGYSHVERKAEYWRVVYNRKQAKERWLIVKRKGE